MQIVGVLSVLLVLVLAFAKSSAEIIWEFGDWSPIPGRCLTCEKGRLSFLESSQGQLSPISGREARNKRRLSESSEISLFTSETPEGKDTSERIQLVYLPEGAINGLRSANAARILSRAKGLSRSKRSSPFFLTSHSFPPIDQVASESTITFREVSPRMPMALVAESGREREAQEQIQLLEAALRAQPTHIQEDELPRVFIAPTNLPPPPGYVKIPLLPNRKHAENKEVLPGTFLTSELHQELPPGFIQVPLPERIAQLSHAIPFVDPRSNRVLQSRVNNQGGQLDSNLRIRQPEQQRTLGQSHQNAFIPPGEFTLRQPPQVDPRKQQQFAIQEHIHRVQPPQQQVVPEARFNNRPKINRGSIRHNQNPNFVSVPNLQSLGQGIVQDNQRHQIRPEILVDQNLSPVSNVQDQNSFVEIGSSVIKTPESLGDLREKHILEVPRDSIAQDLGVEEKHNPTAAGNIRETFGRQKTLDDTRDHLPLDEIQVIGDKDIKTSVPLDTITNTPFQLSPKPIEVDALPQSPQEPDNIQPAITRGPPVKLSPKPVIDFEEESKIGKPVRPKARGRGRPSRLNSSHSLPKSRRRPNRTRIKAESEDILKVGAQVKNIRTTTPQTVKNAAVNPRSRSNFNRRRKPQQKLRNLSENSNDVITTNKETSTIFPPFSVAKKLNGATQSVDSQRKEASRGRRRFGSRIRQRGRGGGNADEDDSSRAVERKTNGILSTDQEQVVESRPQRLQQRGGRRRRIRDRNRRPAGKRRRILNRVRKINGHEKTNLNGDGLLKRNELRGSESARISISRPATNQDTDPIAQALDLINQREDITKTKNENQNHSQALETPKEPQNFEENTTSSPPTQGMEDIFNLLNLGKIKQEGTGESTTASNFNEDDIFPELDPSLLQTDNIGHHVRSSR